MRSISSFVALGDSFSEGVGDPHADGSGLYGWADRFAERLGAHFPGLRYANLAIRGKTVGQVLDEQVPVAVAMAPDLVSIAAGGNDLLRPRSDPDALAQVFDEAVVGLHAAGRQVMVFTGFDTRTFPVLRMIRGKAAAYNMHVRVIADRRGCHLVDLWSMRVLADPHEWADDRLHLAADGHRRVALRACEVMGVPVDEDWRDPLPTDPESGHQVSGAADWIAARRQDAHWATAHAVPWLNRRLRRTSSGDGVPPKRPDLLPL
jgi:lysophospholipase L1-like esterase